MVACLALVARFAAASRALLADAVPAARGFADRLDVRFRQLNLDQRPIGGFPLALFEA